MLPTLSVAGDSVLINKQHRRGRGIVVGDLVNIKHPMFPEEGAIKRVLGMPGDFVGRDTPGLASGDGERGKVRGEGLMIQVCVAMEGGRNTLC